MRVNCKQLYTESLGCNIASDSASVKLSQLQIHANHVVNLPHYTKFLVNYPFVPLTAHSDIRITTRIGIYPKKPCQLSLSIIDLSIGIQNQYESAVTYPKELSTYPFASLTEISYSESPTLSYNTTLTPSSGNMEPPPVEIKVDPSSGNW